MHKLGTGLTHEAFEAFSTRLRECDISGLIAYTYTPVNGLPNNGDIYLLRGDVAYITAFYAGWCAGLREDKLLDWPGSAPG